MWNSVIGFFKIPDDSYDHSKLRNTVQKWAIMETSHPSLHQKLLKAGPALLHYTIGLSQYIWRGNCEMKKKNSWRTVKSLTLDKILGLFLSSTSQARRVPAASGGRLQREAAAFLAAQVICLPTAHWVRGRDADSRGTRAGSLAPTQANLAGWGHGIIQQLVKAKRIPKTKNGRDWVLPA